MANVQTKKRGMFILFEGCDKVGKTTQCLKLVQYIDSTNQPIGCMMFPNRGSLTTGWKIDMYLTNKQNMTDWDANLLFSQNRWEQAEELKTKINQGITFVVDRYAYSGAAYTAAKGHYSLAESMKPDCGLPKPDVIIYLKNDDDYQMSQRISAGSELYDVMKFQQEVSKQFDQLKENDPDTWIEISTEHKSIDEVHEEIKTIYHSITVNEPLAKIV